MDIKEFKQIHEYINLCIDENNEELINLINDIKYDLYLIKESLHIEDKIEDNKISGN